MQHNFVLPEFSGNFYILRRDASRRHGFFRSHLNRPLCIHGLSQRLILMCIKNGFICDFIARDFITCCLPSFKEIIFNVDISRCKYF